MEIRQWLGISVSIIEFEPGLLEAKVTEISYPGGSERTLKHVLSSDASSLFQELVSAVDQSSFTFLATTDDGTIRPLADRVC